MKKKQLSMKKRTKKCAHIAHIWWCLRCGVIEDKPKRIGVSQWMNCGEKYHYDKFWKKKIIDEVVEMINKIDTYEKPATNYKIELDEARI